MFFKRVTPWHIPTSVIVNTYDSPVSLEKVLWGFKEQCRPDFQIIIADDGSKHDTQNLIENFRQTSGINIEHLWHEDDGCQKSVMFNQAIQRAVGDYLIFTEGELYSSRRFCARA